VVFQLDCGRGDAACVSPQTDMSLWFFPDDGAVILVGITLASKIRTKTQANSA
jgi:hypothetical protein